MATRGAFATVNQHQGINHYRYGYGQQYQLTDSLVMMLSMPEGLAKQTRCSSPIRVDAQYYLGHLSFRLRPTLREQNRA
ncbi:MAG: hypothetical protein F6K50_08385 [Moorea sp. SIO3I7]|uniref:hypothetical protein n=1 Tax=Moorena sp. SIO3I8 TaxID=2607833 RepID=UPI0013C17934|nr:hypothetical protein [Moorena sp. SIO3I8]NEN95541.1 hypothetical protein [Moorena sp. SIO3I7]NEO10165.1 hypothetical protein [Moorena sp. SIO3I8]